MQVAENRAVTIHYTLTNRAGDVVDSSRDGEPLPYIHGIGALVPGLESELEGKSAGDNVAVIVQPEERGMATRFRSWSRACRVRYSSLMVKSKWACVFRQRPITVLSWLR